VLIGEISNRWSNSSSHPTAAGVSMADVHAHARAHGYAGVISWAWTCMPHLDAGCVSREHLAAGLRAAAPPRVSVPRAVLDALHVFPAFLSRSSERGEIRGAFGRALGGGAGMAGGVAGGTGDVQGSQQQQQHRRLRDYVCSCGSNRSPDRRYLCSEQAMWGKCEASWMKRGHCLGWCHNCAARTPERGPHRPEATPPHGPVNPHLSVALTVVVALGLAGAATLYLTIAFGIAGTKRGRPSESGPETLPVGHVRS